jgi:hypothetical protein
MADRHSSDIMHLEEIFRLWLTANDLFRGHEVLSVSEIEFRVSPLLPGYPDWDHTSYKPFSLLLADHLLGRANACEGMAVGCICPYPVQNLHSFQGIMDSKEEGIHVMKLSWGEIVNIDVNGTQLASRRLANQSIDTS